MGFIQIEVCKRDIGFQRLSTKKEHKISPYCLIRIREGTDTVLTILGSIKLVSFVSFTFCILLPGNIEWHTWLVLYFYRMVPLQALATEEPLEAQVSSPHHRPAPAKPQARGPQNRR